MKIEHSELLNEFITFWFETKTDGVLLYETYLDYVEMTWETRDVLAPESYILTGSIEKDKPEHEEELRIRDVVAKHLQNT